jgi:hypothetical protein
MSRALLFCLVCLAPAGAYAQVEDPRILGRGDSNNDHTVNVTDVIYLNSYLYNGGPAPPCMNQADANDDGRVDVSDPIYLLNYLFQGGPAPPWPGPNNIYCVNDPAPFPGCANPCG